MALNQLSGAFSDKIREIREDLTDILVDITVNIDYPDEDIEEMTYEKLTSSVRNVKKKISKLLSTADTGRIIREGPFSIYRRQTQCRKIVADERPDGRKQSHRYRYSGNYQRYNRRKHGNKEYSRSDYRHGGDTRYRRHNRKDRHRKSKTALSRADLIIFVIDASRPLEEEDMQIMSHVAGRRAIVLLNKSDKGLAADRALIEKRASFGGHNRDFSHRRPWN